MTELFAPLVDGLLTYAIHSTLLLGGVALAQHWGAFVVDTHRELAWKFALVGAVLSALAQASLVERPLGGRLTTLPTLPVASAAGDSAPEVPTPAAVSVGTDRALAAREPTSLVTLAAPRRRVPGQAPPDAAVWVISLWLGGVLVLVLRQVVARVRLARQLAHRRPIRSGPAWRLLHELCRAAGCPTVRLSLAPGLASPIVLARREICLPFRACCDLGERQLRALLAHELAHVLRRDAGWLQLCAVLETLFFFQPLNRRARREIVNAAELLTDRSAVTLTADSRGLAECLAEVAGWVRQQHAPAAVGMAASGLAERVRRLAANQLQGSHPVMNARLRFASLTVLIVITAVLLPGVGLFTPAVAAGSSSRHVSITDEGAEVRVNIETRDDELGLQLEARGEIVFADDDSDIVSMGEGDSFDLTVRQHGRRYRARIDGRDGGLERTWWVDGERRDWDGPAQAWFAEILPDVMRRSGLNAENRVAHILSTRGVPGVLDEIELVHGDHTRRVYFTQLMSQADPEPEAMRRAVELAGSRMRSDFELGSTLKTMLNEPGLDARAWAAFFEAARSIGSDFEQRQVLVALADSVEFDRELLEAYLKTATDIGSDFEMRQALSALLDAPALDEDTLSRLLQVSKQIGSDFEHASLLVQAAPRVEGRAVAAYLDASGDIGSDFEQRRALAALSEAVRLSTDQAIQFLDAAGGIGSDFELAELMLQSLPYLPDDPAVRRRFLDTANSKLGSQFERTRVLAALSE